MDLFVPQILDTNVTKLLPQCELNINFKKAFKFFLTHWYSTLFFG